MDGKSCQQEICMKSLQMKWKIISSKTVPNSAFFCKWSTFVIWSTYLHVCFFFQHIVQSLCLVPVILLYKSVSWQINRVFVDDFMYNSYVHVKKIQKKIWKKITDKKIQNFFFAFYSVFFSIFFQYSNTKLNQLF